MSTATRSTLATYDEVLAALAMSGKQPQKEGGQIAAFCPAHDDQRNRSLSLKRGEDDRPVLHCFAGCSFQEILQALGLAAWQRRSAPRQKKHYGPVIERYDYRKHGELHYQVQRHADPKDFTQRRSDGNGGWIYNLDGVERILYNRDAIEAASLSEVIGFVEGEKDANQGIADGFTFTTSAQGASSWSKTVKDARDVLRGRRVAIIPDADGPGEKYARQIARDLYGVAASVKIVHLPGLTHRDNHGEDYSDWRAKGHTSEELRHLIADASEWTPPQIPEQQTLDQDTWRPQVQSARDLMAKSFDPIHYAVQNVIAEGLTLLGAKPKKGKTVLMLNLAISVAGGKSALGQFATSQSEVLYLALEDNERRMQRRLTKMLGADETMPDALKLVYQWLPLDRGGLEALDTYLDEHPATKLVIVDTLHHVRTAPRGDTNAYSADYEALKPLLTLANTRKVAIVAITHTRKMAGSDPLDEISGSVGLTAGVDNIIVLRSHDNLTELVRVGRDYEDDEVYALKGDREHLWWTYEGNADELRRSSERTAILETIGADKGGLRPGDIAKRLDKPSGHVRQLLYKMKQSGEVTVDKEGMYHIGNVQPERTDNGDNGDNDNGLLRAQLPNISGTRPYEEPRQGVIGGVIGHRSDNAPDNGSKQPSDQNISDARLETVTALSSLSADAFPTADDWGKA